MTGLERFGLGLVLIYSAAAGTLDTHSPSALELVCNIAGIVTAAVISLYLMLTGVARIGRGQ